MCKQNIKYLIEISNNDLKEKEMTQLIASICDNGEKIVAVSDRMVSTGDMTLTYEPEKSYKFQLITCKCIMLNAGTIHEPDLVIDIRAESKGKERILDIAEIAKENFQKLRRKHIIDEVLKPIGFDSLQEYYQCQKMLHDSIVFETGEKIKNYELELVFLLTGIDSQGGHIMRVNNPGIWRSFDSLGHISIGMGDRHVRNVFAWYRYNQSISLNKAIYINYEAKKKSEMASGIGKETDILIISDKGIEKVDDSVIGELERIYNEREESEDRRNFTESIKSLKLQSKKIEYS